MLRHKGGRGMIGGMMVLATFSLDLRSKSQRCLPFSFAILVMRVQESKYFKRCEYRTWSNFSTQTRPQGRRSNEPYA